jgi:hypothetical protein
VPRRREAPLALTVDAFVRCKRLLASAFAGPRERTAEETVRFLWKLDEEEPVSVEEIVLSALVHDTEIAFTFRSGIRHNAVDLVELERGEVARVVDADCEPRLGALGHG